MKCGACSTDNRDAAKFCKGCGGKLAQAWQGAGARATGAASPEAPAIILTGQPLRPEPLPAAPPAPVSASAPASARTLKTVVLLASTAVALVTMGGLVWSQRGREIEAPAAGTATVAVTAEAPVPDSAVVSALTAAPPLVPAAAQPAPPVMAQTVETLSAAAMPSKPVRKRAAPRVQAPVVAEAPPPPAPAAPAPPPPPPVPEATCGGLNFIAKARCLAAECAKPGVGAHPQCEAVRRQQRIDDEKRNPSGG